MTGPGHSSPPEHRSIDRPIGTRTWSATGSARPRRPGATWTQPPLDGPFNPQSWSVVTTRSGIAIRYTPLRPAPPTRRRRRAHGVKGGPQVPRQCLDGRPRAPCGTPPTWIGQQVSEPSAVTDVVEPQAGIKTQERGLTSGASYQILKGFVRSLESPWRPARGAGDHRPCRRRAATGRPRREARRSRNGG